VIFDRHRRRGALACLIAAALSLGAGGVLAPDPAQAAARGPRVLMIGDSTLAALAWYPRSQSGFDGLNYVLDAQSCRAVTTASCVGRTDPRTGRRTRPANALSVLRSYPAGSFDELVLMVGYDESYTAFRQSIGIMTQAARDRGIDHITWLTFRTDVSYVPPLDAERDYSYRSNNSLLRAAARTSGGYISLLDWNAHVNARSGLVERDGVHLTAAGAASAAALIRDAVLAHWGGGSSQSSPAAPSARLAPRTDLPTWGYGTVSEQVKELQRLLIAVGASDELADHGRTGRFFAVTQRAVRNFQQRIRDRNDASMVVDGIVGPATWAWLVELSGSEPDLSRTSTSGSGNAGSASAAPAAASGTAARPNVPADRPTWGYGTIGEPVKELQRLLIELDASAELAAHGPTGKYYAVTQRAVRNFQQRVRDRHDSTMVVDGVVGPSTWAWLLELTGDG
jgi:peptidoglycan hydrolase-like protein with peptidoglycan-binding domain